MFGSKIIVGWFALGLCAVGASAGTVVDTASGPGSRTYELVLDSTATWDQANAAAKAKGGYLATIGDASEQSIAEQMLSNSGAPSGSYWFGLREVGSEGNYVFLSGVTPGYNHFLPNPVQPDNNGLGESRGSVLWTKTPGPTSPRNGFWNDLPNKGGYPQVASLYPDLVSQGYFIEYGSANPAYDNGDGDSLIAHGSGPTAIPLPNSLLAMPAVLLLAGYAVRRMRKTQTI